MRRITAVMYPILPTVAVGDIVVYIKNLAEWLSQGCCLLVFVILSEYKNTAVPRSLPAVQTVAV